MVTSTVGEPIAFPSLVTGTLVAAHQVRARRSGRVLVTAMWTIRTLISVCEPKVYGQQYSLSVFVVKVICNMIEVLIIFIILIGLTSPITVELFRILTSAVCPLFSRVILVANQTLTLMCFIRLCETSSVLWTVVCSLGTWVFPFQENFSLVSEIFKWCNLFIIQEINGTLRKFWEYLQKQRTPSPSYPLLQWHLKDPIVFVQVPFLLSQLWVPSLHSSISSHIKNED